MGEVFLARDSRLERPVALKCLVSAGVAAAQDLRDRVIREARMAARITHPHVAAVHDIIEHDGRTFMVMEYVEGESLAVAAETRAAGGRAGHRAGAAARRRARQRPSRRRHPPRSQAGEHPGDAGRLREGPRLRDRDGLRGAGHRGDAHDGGRRGRGAAAGTPGYMSPEQTLGRNVDERSDIFSLSVVLFEMATGRRPVESRDPWEIMVATMRGLPRADAHRARGPREPGRSDRDGLAADPRQPLPVRRGDGRGARGHGRARSVPPTPSARAWTLRAVAVVAILPVLVWALGRISSVGFNNTLERTGAFAAERPSTISRGARDRLVAPPVYGGLAILFLGRRVSPRAAGPVGAGRPPPRRRRRARRGVAERLALHDPIVLAQALAALGLVALARVVVALQRADARVGHHPISSDRRRSEPGAAAVRQRKRADALSSRPDRAAARLLAGPRAGHSVARRLGTRRGVRRARSPWRSIVAALLLLTEVPYRIFFKSNAPGVEFRGQRCYVIGEDKISAPIPALLPGVRAPPRNMIVDTNDPAVHPSGDRKYLHAAGDKEISMRHARVLMLMMVAALWPATAHAARGWWGWLEELSGPGPFMGVMYSTPVGAGVKSNRHATTSRDRAVRGTERAK